jgi:hypothetical protein
MTGHEIAENLRGSKLKWGRCTLFNQVTKSYCVLGIKAREGKVSKSFLSRGFQGYYSDPEFKLFTPLEAGLIRDVYGINDSTRTKEACIELFDNPKHHDINYPIEKFVKWLLLTEREWRKTQPKKQRQPKA